MVYFSRVLEPFVRGLYLSPPRTLVVDGTLLQFRIIYHYLEVLD